MAEAQTPTPRELEILKVLWELGPASVRDVYRRMRDDRADELAYNTVQTLMRIMEEKQLVTHRLEGRAFVYTPLYSREATVRGFVDRVFDGAAEELVLTLLQSEQLSPSELERIQAMIQQARKKAAKNG